MQELVLVLKCERVLVFYYSSSLPPDVFLKGTNLDRKERRSEMGYVIPLECMERCVDAL